MAKKETVFGLHAVQSLLESGATRITQLWVLKGRSDAKVDALIRLAKSADIHVVMQSKKTLDDTCEGNHQGVIAFANPAKQYTENELYPLIEKTTNPLVLVLDGVTDPHNLGACLRTADAAGCCALVVPKDNAVGLTDVAKKVACGAAESVPVVAVTNLARALKKMQELGLWVAGTTGDTQTSLFDADLTGPRVIVMGAEGNGMRRLTTETCDTLVKIPMQGAVSSLNVSVATGVVLFEVMRQRQNQ